MVERMVEHRDARIAQGETQFGADLEVLGQQPGARRHRRQFLAHRRRQRLPAGEIARVVLGTGAGLAQGRHRYGQVAAHRHQQAQRRQRPGRLPPRSRPAMQHHRRGRQQGQVGRHRPVETDPLAVCEKAQHEQPGQHERAEQPQETPLRPRRPLLPAGDPGRLQQGQRQQRRHQQHLHRHEGQAAGVQGPRVAVQQLEAQPGLAMFQVPPQQRQPRQRADQAGQQHPRIAQQAPALRQPRDHRHRHQHSPGEAVVAQCPQRQAKRQLQRTQRRDLVQQPRHRMQAQHRGQRQRHVRQRQDPERAQQRQQHRQGAGLPAMDHAEPAPPDPRHPPRQQRADQQERHPQRQHVLAAQGGAQPGQPRGHPRQVRIGHGQVPALLPVEGLVHEQRQPCGHHQLERTGQRPARQEHPPRALLSVHLPLHSSPDFPLVQT